MTKSEIVTAIYDGVKAAAIHRSRTKEQAQDLLQEGLTAVLEVIDKYDDRPDEDLIRLASKIAYNQMTDYQRREINWNRGNIFVTKTDDRPIDTWQEDDTMRDPSDDPVTDTAIDEMHERMFVTVLMSKLNIVERKVLRERLSPSKTTWRIVLDELAEKQKRRAAGELVMNVHAVEITDTHIAKSLKMSKATVSRYVKHIQEEASQLRQE
jgi:RNA polymerase sigma factor (sigma-70 family)